MSSPEFDELLASVQELVRRAYKQGRQDALKAVVATLQNEDPAPRPLAIAAPAKTQAAKPSPERDTRPWWNRIH